MKTVELTDEQYDALLNGESITIKPPKKNANWFPEIGERYWFVSASSVQGNIYTEDGIDNRILCAQDPMRTEKEATKKHEQQKALVQVNRQVRDIIAKEYPDWSCNWNNHSMNKYYPVFNHFYNKLEIQSCFYVQSQFLFEYAPKSVWERIDTNLIRQAIGVPHV